MRCDQMPDEQPCSLSETPKDRFARALDMLMVEYEDELSISEFISVLRTAVVDLFRQSPNTEEA